MHIKKKTPTYILICLPLFYIFLVSYQFLLPVGDEPDYYTRLIEYENSTLKLNVGSFLDKFFGLSQMLLTEQVCILRDQKRDLFFTLDLQNCTKPLAKILPCVLIAMTITIPIFLIATFRRYQPTEVYKIEIIKSKSLVISLLMPSIIYFLSLESQEIFSLAISLSFYIFHGSLILLLFFTYAMYKIDTGNALVFFFIYFSVYIANKMRLLIAEKKINYLIIILCIVFLFFSELLFQMILDKFPNEYLHNLYIKAFYSDIKISALGYFTRILNFFVSFVFMTPSGLKSISSVILFYCALLYSVLSLTKLRFSKFHDNLSNVGLILYRDCKVVLVSVLITIIILPHYAYAKYYVFTIPFLISLLLVFFSETHTILLLSIINILILLSLFFS